MKVLSITTDEIIGLGFIFLGKFPLEKGDYYNWYRLQKNDSEIHVTYEFSANDKFENFIFEFNGEELKGREIKKSDVELLIEIM